MRNPRPAYIVIELISLVLMVAALAVAVHVLASVGVFVVDLINQYL